MQITAHTLGRLGDQAAEGLKLRYEAAAKQLQAVLPDLPLRAQAEQALKALSDDAAVRL